MSDRFQLTEEQIKTSAVTTEEELFIKKNNALVDSTCGPPTTSGTHVLSWWDMRNSPQLPA